VIVTVPVVAVVDRDDRVVVAVVEVFRYRRLVSSWSSSATQLKLLACVGSPAPL
jgi:hypothetical protein